MIRGNRTVAHHAINATAASNIIDCNDYPDFLVSVELGTTGIPNWTITFLGAIIKSDTFTPMNKFKDDGTLVQVSSGALTVNKCFIVKDVPRHVKVIATKNSGTGTCTVKVQPFKA